MILFILLLCGIFFLGSSFTSLFKCKLSWWERFGLAYGLGLGTLTFGVFLPSLVGAPFGKYTLVFALAVWLATIWYVKRKRRDELNLRIHWDRPSLPEITLAGGILLVSLASLFESVVQPIWSLDAVAIWAVKGKAIFSLGTVRVAGDYGYHAFYPLNIPIAIALFYYFGEPFVKSIFPFYFMAILMVFYGSLRRHGCHNTASAGTLILALTPLVFEHSTIAYADLPMAFYYTSSVIYLYAFCKENNRAFLMLSSVLVGMGCWTRPDGPIWLFPNLTVLTICALRRKQWLDPILYAGPILFFFVPWSVFTHYIIKAGTIFYLDAALKSLKQLLTLNIETAHLWKILCHFYRRCVALGSSGLRWGYVWLLFFSVLLLYCTRIRKYSYLLALIGLDILVLFFIYYSALLDGRAVELRGGFNRVVLHFFPLVLFQTILLISDDIRRWRSKADTRRSY